MNGTQSAQLEAYTLGKEYKVYIDTLWARWIMEHPFHCRNVYEAMDPWEREELQRHIDKWGVYITPFAEKWWRERGYGVRWPEQNTEPMKIFKLETAK